jgi:hypothetical protein
MVTRESIGESFAPGIVTSTQFNINLGGSGLRAVVLFCCLTNNQWAGFQADIGGEALSWLATGGGIQLWGRLTTLTGAQVVHMSWTNADSPQGNLVSYIGVDPDTPFDNPASHSELIQVWDLPITSRVGDLTVSTCFGIGASTAPATDQVSDWYLSFGGVQMRGDHGGGQGTTTHHWSHDGFGMDVVGINVRAGGAAPDKTWLRHGR